MPKSAKLPDLSGYEFKKLYRTCTNPRGKVRLLALHHLSQGKTISYVMESLCVTRQTVMSWLSWYERVGINKIISKVKGRGRKKKLAIPKEELQSGILELQEQRGGGRIVGKDIISWIKENYEVEYAPGTIYGYLKQEGLSWISCRSKHPKQNPVAQEEFKKNFK